MKTQIDESAEDGIRAGCEEGADETRGGWQSPAVARAPKQPATAERREILFDIVMGHR